MEQTARLYHCVRCHCQVLICSRCDRGNLYCGSKCAQPARKESLSLAGARYQKSYRGKLNHAARQQRYRERQKEKVTHHGSQPNTDERLSFLPANKSTERSLTPVIHELHCHFCAKGVSDLLRISFLGHGINRVRTLNSACAQGP